MKILITGGSGLVGSSFTEIAISQGHDVAWLSRQKQISKGVRTFLWDINKSIIDIAAIQWADIIIHLAGADIAEKKWSKSRKKEILESRIKSTAILIDALHTTSHHVHTIIAVSAIGFYGDNRTKELDETDCMGTIFLSNVCSQWEQATKLFKMQGVRLITFRLGIVLSKNGGALLKLAAPVKFALAPLLGNGKQVYSWIHIDDVCGIFLCAIHDETVEGIYNAVAPEPATQKNIMQEIILVKKKFAVMIPIPAIIIKILLGEMSETVLISQNVSSKKIITAGYSFKYPELKKALQHIYGI